MIVFEQVAGPLMSVTGRLVSGDSSEHGFHVHQYGDVSAPDGTSTGGHLNLDSATYHGLPGVNSVRHLGDFGSFKVYDGVGMLSLSFFHAIFVCKRFTIKFQKEP